ncbi:MAG: FKBP-type peptidyl-prolyl cis-trans isomerase [Gemmatimonadales bacterium]|nr:MAG: FKBP-type peptidyl-prolyl cis-trans isomerase [Gemmatimonadales bacterium]
MLEPVAVIGAQLPRPVAVIACRMPGPLAVIAVALVASTGCATGPWEGTVADPAQVDFAPELEVDLEAMERTPSGLYLQDLAEGAGPVARSNSLVTLHYATWLPDGSVVDTSVGGDPFTMRLGGSEVIRGWNQGIPGMKVGGRRRLVVRPGLAYGSRGTPNVPGNSTLVFEVQLLDVR